MHGDHGGMEDEVHAPHPTPALLVHNPAGHSLQPTDEDSAQHCRSDGLATPRKSRMYLLRKLLHDVPRGRNKQVNSRISMNTAPSFPCRPLLRTAHHVVLLCMGQLRETQTCSQFQGE